ncbi:MAG: DUF58 domain-containing protein [Defluviitaleaceae bacterium]|nr:DUF58 domain-containing protein [Defluviitaleaceae bacterium]
MRRNRILYLLLLAITGAVAYVYGERLLYVALAVLVIMPVASLVLTFILLYVLRVEQTLPQAVVKGERALIRLHLRNVSPAFFGSIACNFHTDDFALEMEEAITMWLRAPSEMQNFDDRYRGVKQEIPFSVKYRGQFNVGLKSIRATDLLGLFRLTRRMNRKKDLLVLPRVIALDSLPLATHLLTQAHSRFDIKDEDYTTISDIRPYLQTDSIKRVHWKLTAKRNEWLVKNFQSNALNKVTMLLDTRRLPIGYREQIVLEDSILEMALGVARFCLYRGMPVELTVGEGATVACHNPASFETIYHLAAQIEFNPQPTYTPLSMIAHCLNDASGYLNAMIFTTRLDGELYERLLNGKNNGHYLAIYYFPTVIKDADSEEIFRMLEDSGAPIFRVEDDMYAEAEEDNDAA